MEGVVETFLQVFWFAIFAMTAGASYIFSYIFPPIYRYGHLFTCNFDYSVFVVLFNHVKLWIVVQIVEWFNDSLYFASVWYLLLICYGY